MDALAKAGGTKIKILFLYVPAPEDSDAKRGGAAQNQSAAAAGNAKAANGADPWKQGCPWALIDFTLEELRDEYLKAPDGEGKEAVRAAATKRAWEMVFKHWWEEARNGNTTPVGGPGLGHVPL